MYSGGESTDSQKYAQWAMNPAAYQNAGNDQVDWAALAQQWIIMKEAGPPPIPDKKQHEKSKPDTGNQEGGEAEMDMDTEKEDVINWNPSGPEDAPPAPGAEAWANWNPSATQNWGWNNSWNPPSAVPPPPSMGPIKTPLLPTPNNVYSGIPDSVSDNAMSYGGYNSNSPSTNNFNSQPAFWTGMAVGKITQTEIKPHNKRYSKVNVPTKVTIITPAPGAAPLVPVAPEAPVVPTPVPTLDANKRKQLPAWIREGLEKMERDKLKQMEKEKEKLVRDEYTEKIKQEEKEKMEILKSTIKEKNLLRKSRFESDNENSEDDTPVNQKKVSPPPPVPLTPEELMLKVRKTMTEILLKVTNQLIEQVCKEERQRYIKKRRASDQLASAPSGAIIRAKLGLGAYDDGSSSSGESDSDDNREDRTDSDVELRESIRKRQAAFSKTEQEIEDRLAEVERRKEQSRSPSRSRSSSRDSHDNESQVEANAQDTNRNYSDAEKSPKRPSSPDANSTGSSDYMDAKSRRRSSSSSDSRRKNRDSSRDRSRSRSDSAEPSRKTSRGYSKSPRRRSRSLSTGKGSKRERSVGSYRRESCDSKKRSRRSRSDSRYSKRSRRSRSRSRSSYSSRKSSKRSRYSPLRSRTRSRSRDRHHHSSKKSSSSRSYDSQSKRLRRSRSRSYERSKRRSTSSTRTHKKSRSHRSSSRSRRRRSSRSSSGGKRSYRR